MLGKFAIYMCPEPKCPKIALSAEHRHCPTHGKDMVRTVVMTEGYVDGLKVIQNIKDVADDVLRKFDKGGGR